MGQGSLFGGGGDGGRVDDEGIRLIGAKEAAEVAERTDAARRRGGDVPRYGDRPPPIETSARPALRFPLADSDDAAAIEPLKVAPVDPHDSSAGSGAHENLDERASSEDPVMAVGGEGEASELPHWTEPATGEVPKVVVGQFDENPDAWNAFAAASPRWRGDQESDWDQPDDLSDLAAGSRVGALAPTDPDAPTDDEYLSFDDLDDLAEPVRPKSTAKEDLPPPPAAAVDLPDPPAGAGEPPRTGRVVKKVVKKSSAKSGQTVDPKKIVTKKVVTTPDISGAGTDELPKAKPARRASGPPHPGVVVPPGDSDAATAGDGGRDLGLSVSVGAMISVAAFFLFWLGANVGAAFVVVFIVLPVIVMSALELFNALAKADYHPATLLGWVACAGMALGACWRGDSGIALILALSVVFGFAWYLLDLGPGPMVKNLGATMLGIAYVGVLGSYAGAILHVPGVGVGVLFVVAWTVVWSDVGGYLIGRQIGRTPLSAASPNKTREGLVGGVLLAAVMGLLVSRFVAPFDGSLGASLLFVVVIAAVAPFGDLCESRLKRDLGVKDMSSLIPGHGGILDRFDAMLVALPIGFYLLAVLGLV